MNRSSIWTGARVSPRMAVPPTFLASLTAAFLLALGLTPSPVQAGRLAGDLASIVRTRGSRVDHVRVIVQFSRPVSDRISFAGSFKSRLMRSHGLLNAVTLDVPRHLVEPLSRDPNVAWISPDRPLAAQWDEDVKTTGADAVWSSTGFTGKGVRVAVLDTGVRDGGNSDWKNSSGSRIVAFKDFVNGRNSPYDDNGHGTHVAGIVLANGDQCGQRILGIAPMAELVAVKVLDRRGIGTVDRVIAALDWCVANKNRLNIRVINLSLGHDPRESYQTDPLCTAVRRAVRAGIVVIASAGNKGKDLDGSVRYGGILCPGNEPSAVTVGALNTRNTASRADDGVCTYSSRGPTFIDHLTKPDLVAPGNRIVSMRSDQSFLDLAYPGNRVDPANPFSLGQGNYYMLSGTSMAAPQVSGTAALMLQANPGLTPNLVKALLTYTAEKLPVVDAAGLPLSAGLSVLTQGAGSLNALGAVQAARSIDCTQPVGMPWLRAPLPMANTLAGRSFPWSAQVLHGQQVLWGEDLLGTNQILWGEDPFLPGANQILWGEQVLWGNQILWGEDGTFADQMLWGNQVLWGNQILWGEEALGELRMQTLILGE